MKKVFSIFISLLVLLIIYLKFPFTEILSVLKQTNIKLLIFAFLIFIPILLLTSYRFKILAPRNYLFSYGSALQLVMIGNFFNIFLPAKMGDITKAYLLKKKHSYKGGLAFALVIFEKIADFFGIFTWALLGLFFLKKSFASLLLIFFAVLFCLSLVLMIIFWEMFSEFCFGMSKKLFPFLEQKLDSFQLNWREMQGYTKANKKISIQVLTLAVLISFLHFFQIWLLITSINAYTSLLNVLALTPYATLAGLFPFTFAGVGTRDAALIVLFQPYIGAVSAIALGVLCTLRVFFYGLLGLPLFIKSAVK